MLQFAVVSIEIVLYHKITQITKETVHHYKLCNEFRNHTWSQRIVSGLLSGQFIICAPSPMHKPKDMLSWQRPPIRSLASSTVT